MKPSRHVAGVLASLVIVAGLSGCGAEHAEAAAGPHDIAAAPIRLAHTALGTVG